MKQVLYFGAEWCGPCQVIKPYIKQLQGQMSVAMIDADSNSDLIAKWQVRNIPTMDSRWKAKPEVDLPAIKFSEMATL